MSSIERSALLPYSAQQMYDLINDVESYPQFMEGCVGAEIIHQDEQTMEARLDLNKAGFSYSFTTQNTLTPPVNIELQLVEGPFNDFKGNWSLEPLSETACKITLSLDFTLKTKMLGLAVKAVFNPLADNLVDALVKRAKQQYE